MDTRLLGPEDVDAFRSIRLEALRIVPEAYASTLLDWENLSGEEWLRRLTTNPVFVAFRNDDPVGIMGFLRQQSSKMAHRATIVMVYVRENERGTGLAAKLLDALLAHARALGLRQIELAVSAENSVARRFYEREGFIPVGTIPAGFIHDGREIDEILMVRRLK